MGMRRATARNGAPLLLTLPPRLVPFLTPMTALLSPMLAVCILLPSASGTGCTRRASAECRDSLASPTVSHWRVPTRQEQAKGGPWSTRMGAAAEVARGVSRACVHTENDRARRGARERVVDVWVDVQPLIDLQEAHLVGLRVVKARLQKSASASRRAQCQLSRQTATRACSKSCAYRAESFASVSAISSRVNWATRSPSLPWPSNTPSSSFSAQLPKCGKQMNESWLGFSSWG